jgi:hypothetical protein
MEIECSICLFSLAEESQEIEILVCSHLFHSLCLNKLKVLKCPLCRHKIEKRIKLPADLKLLITKSLGQGGMVGKSVAVAPADISNRFIRGSNDDTELDELKTKFELLQSQFNLNRGHLKHLHRDIQHKNDQIEELSLKLQELEFDQELQMRQQELQQRNDELNSSIVILERQNLFLEQKLSKYEADLTEITKKTESLQSELLKTKELNEKNQQKLIRKFQLKINDLLKEKNAFVTISKLTIENNITNQEWNEKLNEILLLFDSCDKDNIKQIVLELYSKLQSNYNEYHSYKDRSFKLLKENDGLKQKLRDLSNNTNNNTGSVDGSGIVNSIRNGVEDSTIKVPKTIKNGFCNLKSNKIVKPGSASKRPKQSSSFNLNGDGMGGVITKRDLYFKKWLNSE